MPFICKFATSQASDDCKSLRKLASISCLVLSCLDVPYVVPILAFWQTKHIPSRLLPSRPQVRYIRTSEDIIRSNSINNPASAPNSNLNSSSSSSSTQVKLNVSIYLPPRQSTQHTRATPHLPHVSKLPLSLYPDLP